VRTRAAAAGSALFFAAAPGVVAGVVPLLLTGWHVRAHGSGWAAARAFGALLVVAGASVLVSAFARFVRDGHGTPAPVAPTDDLVTSGLYRYVRNPMYLAVQAAIVGQALLFGQLGLLVYAASVGILFFLFVRFYEEPTLARVYGDRYAAYRDAVPGWWPRRGASARRPRTR
jgi:protein-S-isoprenylcysteine O-methyltransferase Ste14